MARTKPGTKKRGKPARKSKPVNRAKTRAAKKLKRVDYASAAKAGSNAKPADRSEPVVQPSSAKPEKAKDKSSKSKAKPEKAKASKSKAKPSKSKAKPEKAKAKSGKSKSGKAKAESSKAKPSKSKVKPEKAKPSKAKAKSGKAKPSKAKSGKAKVKPEKAKSKAKSGKSKAKQTPDAGTRAPARSTGKGATSYDKEANAHYHKLLVKENRENELQPYQVELLKLQSHLEKTKRRMIVLFEGRDAAGKGGTIRRVTRYMNEKHYRVVALGKPTAEQRTQWYLQRYVEQFPRGGEIVLFDRSWYNRAMVEPVFGFCSDEEHRNFMRGVVGFEKDLVQQGTILVKLYFSVSKKEQLRRFERRRHDPLRQWKLSEVDMQAQDLWQEFTEQKYEMLRRTHTAATPWTVIRSEVKHLARLNAMKVMLDAVNYEGRCSSTNFVPDPNIVMSGAREVELMEAERIRRGKFSA